MVRHILIILTCIVSAVLTVVILIQTPKQESLSTAFNGEKVYVSSLNKTLIYLTYVLLFLLSILLIALKLI